MRKNLFLLVLIIVQAAYPGAQDNQVPEFVNEPMMLKSDGSLGKLEKTAGDAKSFSAETYGYGGNIDMEYVVFQGAHSTVRLNHDARFIIKLSDAEVDPESIFYLTKAIMKKNTRMIYTRKSYGRSTAEQYVNIDFEKLSPGVYKLTPKDMKPGTEYAFVLRNATSGRALVYLFGTN